MNAALSASHWLQFPLFAGAALACWALAIALQLIPATRNRAPLQSALAALGACALLAFAGALWHALERPPMRTLGETRLWYAIFTPLIGACAHAAFRQRWLLAYSLGMGALFVVINLLRPETHNKALMPALQSIWFVPHVLVYIFAYAIFAASSAVAVRGLWLAYRTPARDTGVALASRLVYLGFGFLTLGLLFGALWAKEAWGHYWTWDPKETWALLTWLGYLAYMHIRYRHPEAVRPALWVLALSFVLLLICWFGVNYLPSAAQSVHTYTR
ncbi:ABC-type transport system involved in cytochrome c biogenesis permease subunit [Ereboglobus sp. PH5-5]|uniref:cytochrome c biogenesis protein n=1 Tax=Ereboglobus sp. PH5-5 TaxID=2940529 RepID=UPI0024052086|nr:cytochrome c biogenesis protein CcsA [Ereboglobus sp. PH5-5]MDF9832593.1 ABC-type transport system involved in cytochrome c biogenesis permease subunit [Ereboglobus sp. PH5-5]